MKKSRLRQIIKEEISSTVNKPDLTQGMSKNEKKSFLEAVYRFAEHSQNIYRESSLLDTSRTLSELINKASALTLSETDGWFDKVSVSKHMKSLQENFKLFEKTAKEMNTLQQRLEACYEDIGGTLNKYYDINEIIEEHKINND